MWECNNPRGPLKWDIYCVSKSSWHSLKIILWFVCLDTDDLWSRCPTALHPIRAQRHQGGCHDDVDDGWQIHMPCFIPSPCACTTAIMFALCSVTSSQHLFIFWSMKTMGDWILNPRGEEVELMDNFRSIQGNQDVPDRPVGCFSSLCILYYRTSDVLRGGCWIMHSYINKLFSEQSREKFLHWNQL